MPRPTIRNGYEESLPLQFFLQFQTTGDRFLALSEDQWSTANHEQAASDHINKFQHQFQDPGVAGHCHERPFEELVARFQNHGPAEAKRHAASSVKVIHGSAPKPVHRSALITPPEPCPSLESDHSGSSDGRDASNASLAPGYASATPTAPKRPSRQPDPPIFAYIRQVLASDPSFAEGVISAVSQLPNDRRSLLFEPETECVDGSSSGPSKSSERPSKKRRRSGNNSNGSGGGGGDSPGGSGGAGGGTGDGDGAERGGSGGVDGTPSNKKRNKDKKRRWICPYCLAYPEIHEIAFFSHCSPGNMTEVHLWRSHLDKHHSPKAKNADPNAKGNARFYMDLEQLGAVIEKINSYKERPRQLAKWISYWKALFIDVWRIMFPKERFSHFREPVSPFHLDGDEIANLGQHLSQQAEMLVGPMYDARAEEAVKSKAIASRDDFRPTAEETKDIMSKAIAIVLLNSPAATGATQWLARASPQTLEAAVGQYGDDSEPRPKADVATPCGVPTGADDDGPATPSKSVTVPGTPELAATGPSAAQAALPVLPTVSVPLFPNGTRVDLSPINPDPSQTNNQVGQLTLPPTFYVAKTSPIPLPPLSMASVTDTPGTPASVPQPGTYHTQDTNWQPSVQLPLVPGISMQAIQEKPLSQEEWDLQHVGQALAEM
ncbi:hypothetical protein FALBO_2532 [Fusarium albosuccineum]|uniref:Uncharacterized protein n=1 Tax=Fusarium albosuccineum TaxID=1237068 RepID=A0A8H4PHS6_9HYPO|nr:hypothetical protein FALBO_2532 [Fusarium albosuccineum]